MSILNSEITVFLADIGYLVKLPSNFESWDQTLVAYKWK